MDCVLVTFITFTLVRLFFFFFRPRLLSEVNWGDTHQSHLYRNALSSLQKLACSEIHVKNYRPQILLMSGNPASRVQLLDFAHSITKGDSLLLCAHVIPVSAPPPLTASLLCLQYAQNDRMFSVLRQLGHEIEEWLRTSRLKAFYVNIANEQMQAGMRNVFQLAGLAKLKPNVLMVGFKSNWTTLERDHLGEIEEYVGILRFAPFSVQKSFFLVKRCI